jgi:hypothetical protein
VSADGVLAPLPATAALHRRLHARLGWAADTDEVAAILESTGINDRVAGRDYGHSSVFTLAAQVRAAVARPAPDPVPQQLRLPALGALVRAGLYLTPTVVAVGCAPLIGSLPWYSTTGLLVVGWGAAQALAYLGYRSANEMNTATAARRLALGFATLAAAWMVLLTTLGASPTSFLVSGAQLALFAANTAALVTRAELRTLVAAGGCWVAVGTLAAGARQAGIVILSISLAAMVLVAYLPAWGRGRSVWRPDLRRYATAAGHGAVGAGQAALFILVVLQQAGTVVPAATSAPLLVGVPLTELVLLWHQRRVAYGRVRLTDRTAFRRHLRSVGRTTGLALAAPLVVGTVLALTVATPAGWAVTACTLLTGVNAICLILVAHRRSAGAIALVWLGALLIVISGLALSILQPAATGTMSQCCSLILILLYPPALLAALRAMKDPGSYR